MIKRAKQFDGFTLIELLVVIAIISLLSSVVLASLGGARDSARHIQLVNGLQQIEVGMITWMQSTGRSQWPSHAEVGETLPELIDNTTLGEYLTLPDLPFVDPPFQDGELIYRSYDTNVSSNCGGVNNEGVYISFNIGYGSHPDSPEAHDYLNEIIDGDKSGADYCGKVRTRSGGNDIVWFILSEDGDL